MTVLEKQAVGGFEKQRSETGFRKYLMVGLAALVLGSGLAWTATKVVGSETGTLNPSGIAEFHAAEQVELMRLQWVAQVNATKGNDLVERYGRAHAAEVAPIYAQRASDMAVHQSDLFLASVTRINEQRAGDMVEFKYGLSSTKG